MSASQFNPPGFADVPYPGRGVRIVRIDPSDEVAVTAAASRLVTTSRGVDAGAARHFLNYAAVNRVSLGHFFAAVDGDSGEVLSAALAVPNPGRTAMLFATRQGGRVRSGGGKMHMERTARVIDAACRSVVCARSRLAQALLEPRERAERQMYEMAGFKYLASLSYLQRSTGAIGRAESAQTIEWPAGATLHPYSENLHDAFGEALQKSYVETRDCPALCGMRRPDDVLEGHRATGVFDPDLWTLLRLADEPVGLLLMNPSADGQSIELVYLGVAREARGRNLGQMLMRHGLRQAAARPERSISLAVDDQNTPALRLYFRSGFRRLLRRVAMIRVLDSSP